MAGHSHWANIKRAKAGNDARRGKVWSKIARKIIIAAKAGGGDPAANLSLRYVIDEAKSANMPKDTIEKAIMKGTGELGTENYETVTYEGYGTRGIAFMVEALTNNRARTAPEMRMIFEKYGGNLAQSGSVGYQFTRQGILTIKSDAIDEEKLMNLALEAGAEDVRNEGEVFEVFTAPTQYLKVKEALTTAGIPIEAGAVANLPTNTLPVTSDAAATINRLIEALEDNDDVQAVAHNADLPDPA